MDDVVFVPNATTAVNTVLRNLKFVEGDTIIQFSSTYGACEKTIQYICETTPAKRRNIDVTFPVDYNVLVYMFRHAVRDIQKQGGTAKLAMFDTVVTFPGIRLPWEELVKACQELGVLSLIDGAHGIGHIDLTHLASVSPDFFTSNCYKWLYTPRSCAIFYVPFRNQHLIHSTIPTSHGFHAITGDEVDDTSSVQQDNDRFGDLFKWAATIDQTPYLCVPEATKFREEVCGGEARIRDYCFNLARDGGQVIAKALGTERMQTAQDEMSQCCFTNVRLPLSFRKEDTPNLDAGDGPKIVTWIMDRAMHDYNTWMPGKFYGGVIWIRLSAQVYLEIKDFEWAAGVLKALCERVEKGEWREQASI